MAMTSDSGRLEGHPGSPEPVAVCTFLARGTSNVTCGTFDKKTGTDGLLHFAFFPLRWLPSGYVKIAIENGYL